MEENDLKYYSPFKETLQNKFHHETPIQTYRFITSNIDSIEKNSNPSYNDSFNQKQPKTNQRLNNNHIFFTISSHNSNEDNQKQSCENFSPIVKNLKNIEENDLIENIGLNNSLKENTNSNNENSESNNINEYHTGRWSKEEHEKFIEGILEYGNEWKRVQKVIKTRSSTQARSHAQKYFLKLKKEINYDILSDPEKLMNYIINSIDNNKRKRDYSSEQVEKLMTVIRSNLRAEENVSKSGKEGLSGENNNSNINEKDESGFDDIKEEDYNLAYNQEIGLDLQKKMSGDVKEMKRKIAFCSRKRKSTNDINYNKIFNITKEMSHKSSIDISKTNNIIVNKSSTKNSAQKNIGIKKIKFNIKNDNKNFVVNKNTNTNTNNTSIKNNININNNQKENKNNQPNQTNFYIQNNYINIYNTYNNMNINNYENIPSLYNNINNNSSFNQNNPKINNEIKNNKVSFFSVTKQFNQKEFDKNNIDVIFHNQNFFPNNNNNKKANQDNNKINENNEQNNPFNINFETITSNEMKRKEGYINQYIGEIFDGGHSLSEWTNNNNIFNQV